MTPHPLLVSAAKKGWVFQWKQLMRGLAPCDADGNYTRPVSQKLNGVALLKKDLELRSKIEIPRLVIGKSCPWAHRTWLMFSLRNLDKNLNLLIARPNFHNGTWEISPPWMGCRTLLDLYLLCKTNPTLRATVPALVDPGIVNKFPPRLLGNESSQLVEVLNNWPNEEKNNDFLPDELKNSISEWHSLIQPSVNDGVYKCGFARNQNAYKKASDNLFEGLDKIEEALIKKGPWLCGNKLTVADIRLFPTLIRWEAVYEPLFGCSKKPLSKYHQICKWRKNFYNLPKVSETCDINSWRKDYFGALFPLRPSGIIPEGPSLETIIKG